MSYKKSNWVPYDPTLSFEQNVTQGGTITADKLNNMETGISNAFDKTSDSIGGRNLLQGTSGELRTFSGSNWGSGNLSSDNISLISGQIYTARMWIQGYDVPTYLVMRTFSESGSQLAYATGNIIGANSSGYSTVTWTANSNWISDDVRAVLSFTSPQSATHSGQYSELKLEKGSVATDWCPNPSEIGIGDNSRSLIVNDPADMLDHMSVVFNLPSLRDGTDDAPQFMQVDNKTGLVYWGWQDNNAGSQTIVELDKTGKVLRKRDLKITNVVWLEGCSLYHDATTGHICFIVPTDLNGNWFLYDYDADTKSEEFHMQGSEKHCIDDSGQYFVTEQERYDSTNSINVQTIGFNIYSLSSVLAKKPVLTMFVPVKDSYVRGNTKIQGFQMIGGNLYIGRGGPGQLRTTVINQAGAVLSDYNWNQADIYSLLGLKNGQSVESEGISIIKLNQLTLPALSIITIDDNGYHYGIIAAGDPNGTVIRSTAGLSVAAITRFGAGENELDFVIDKSGPSILDQLLTVRQRKSYTFTVEAGNAGLASQMASSVGVATVSNMDANCNVIRMAVTATDYNASTWTTYFNNGVWSHWSKVVHTADTSNWQKQKITNDDGSLIKRLTASNNDDLNNYLINLVAGFTTFYVQSGVANNPSTQSARGFILKEASGIGALGMGYLVDNVGSTWSISLYGSTTPIYKLLANDSKVFHSTITQLNSTDMNTVRTAGFYKLNSGTNGMPNADEWTIYQVIPLSSTNGVQIAYQTNNAILGMRSWDKKTEITFTSWIKFADDSKVAHLSGANNFDTVPTVNNKSLATTDDVATASNTVLTSANTSISRLLQSSSNNDEDSAVTNSISDTNNFYYWTE